MLKNTEVKKARKNAGLTQLVLAKALNISDRTYRTKEKDGLFTPAELEKLTTLMGVDLEHQVKPEPKKENQAPVKKARLPILESVPRAEKSENCDDFILIGAMRKTVACLAAPPSVGKSYLAMTIAQDLAAGTNLSGIVGKKYLGKPLKVAYLVTEDLRDEFIERQELRTQHFNKKELKNMEGNFDAMFFSEHDDIEDDFFIVAPKDADKVEKQEAKANRDALIEQLKGYDLIMVDTVVEVIGDADETHDSKAILKALKQIAKKTNTLVLIVHHVNKESMRAGVMTLDSVRGGTALIAGCKQIMSINTHKEKGGKTKLTLDILKDNYIRENNKTSLFKEYARRINVGGRDCYSLELDWGEGHMLKSLHQMPQIIKAETPEEEDDTERLFKEIGVAQDNSKSDFYNTAVEIKTDDDWIFAEIQKEPQ